jgi:hypothetical protein
VCTSQAKAGEVLDVIHAVEFSKTAPRFGLLTKKASAHGGPGKK